MEKYIKYIINNIESYLLVTTTILMLSLTSCKSDIGHDVMEDISKEKVYLKIALQNNFSQNSTRAQGNQPSIQRDNSEYEDFVDRICTLVFDSGDGKCLISKVSDSKQYIIRITPGKRDFFFIANYPMEIERELSNISNREQLLNLFKTKRLFTTTYSGKNIRFPMSRIYLQQNISEGGTELNPQLFTPLVNTTKQLAPISQFGHEYNNEEQPSAVRLIRVCAKIELILKGKGVKEISSITYNNAASNYTFMEDNSNTPSTIIQFRPTNENNNTTSIYVAEKIFHNKKLKYWNRDKANNIDEALNGATYIEIRMKEGTIYKIPIICNDYSGNNYMSFSRSTEADYNIIRNNKYQIEAVIPEVNKEINVRFNIQPWDVNESILNFQKATGTMKILPASNHQYDLVNNKTTVTVHQLNDIYFSLHLNAPIGALWTVSITNGLDFEILPATERISNPSQEVAATSGLVYQDVIYYFKVKPKKLFVGTPRYTKIYVTVEGKEVQVAPGYEAMPAGVNNRTLIKQIE